MPGRPLAEIEKQLEGAARQVIPSDWLTDLLSTRHFDDNAASEYLLQSPYYNNVRWDIPQAGMDWDRDERNLGYEPSEGSEEELDFEYELSEGSEGEPDFEYELSEGTEDGKSDEEGDYTQRRTRDSWQNKNERVQQRFMDIFNDVLFYFGLGTSRRALATESTKDEEDDIFYEYDASSSDDPPRFSTRPDLLFLGEDVRQLPRPFDTYNRSMSVKLGTREDLYRGCVAVAKVQKVDGRYGKDALLAKLATCAQQCFLHQPSRRFVYGLALSRSSFRLVYFDRSGAVESLPLNIHANALHFVQVVRMLGDPDLGNLGFDPSIYWENGRRFVDVLEQTLGARKASPRKYEIERIVFHRQQLVGRGTVCWVVTEVDGTERVLMKDIWQEEGEREVLLTFASKRGISGMRKLLGVNKTWASKPLSTSALRLDQSIPATGHKKKMLSRQLLELYGPSIRHFDSGLQLIQGLRDAVVAHHRLVKAGVLHRNITPDAVLLSRDGGESGFHSTLIDMKKATRCVRGRTPAEKDDPHIGTPMFRSANNVLACTTHRQGPRRCHDFLDDLESFLWVYLWVIMVQNGPGEAAFVPEPSSFLAQMLRTDHLGLLHEAKYVFMRHGDNANPTPYFSQTPYPELLDNLRSLCEGYRGAKRGGDDLFPQMDGIYRRYLAFFDSAIEQLGGTSTPLSAAPPLDIDSTSLQHVIKPPTLLPLRRIQPERRARHVQEDGARTTRHFKKSKVVRLALAKRPAKRAREEDSATTCRTKKRRVAPPLLDSRALREDDKKVGSTVNRTPREGTRRSERIREGKVRNARTGANGIRRTDRSKRA